MAAFHQKCGDRVILTNNNKTALRNCTEFNNGIVLSSEPLLDNQIFQVKIEKAINSWSGSIQIGVISCDPERLDLPVSAAEFKQGCWILSGTSILQDGRTSGDESYGADLDKLKEGDIVGVMKTDKGELKFYINGEFQGTAAENIPDRVYAIVDLYGKCAQISIVPSSEQQEMNMNMPYQEQQHGYMLNDRLRFHSRCGTLVKLSCNGRTAERRKPLDEFNNGVVMTHRPLRDNELFEIRIDRLVDKWSGSIEVGVTTHNPSKLEFPATMTNMKSGTTIMSGCGILTNGTGTRREYGEFNLDELREGDRIGMMRKSNGNLHYFINGLDQDVAAKNVPETVWGVVDLYGMTVKVTIVDRDEREEQNLMTRRNTEMGDCQSIQRNVNVTNEDGNDRLTFHPKCGSHAAVINNGRTVHRPNAMDDFNNGVALTNRPLKPNELFEIRLDKMVTKWAGSIEIGVTTHSPNELEYPSTMTNVRSGTWMMTGNGVMHNGSTIVDEYGHNLDRLKVGDRVGASRRACGSLHFYVNGVDQGVAAVNVPERVYGVIDLYGQAAQATLIDILDYSPDTDNSSLSNTTLYSDLRFYHVHGRNARVSNNGLTASRPRNLGEFNHAIVITNRPLREGEMFEVKIEVLVDRWSGSIEAGVTAIRPEEFEFPSTMTDMDRGTWMLSGSSVMKDGFTLRSGYPCDLDTLPVGSRIGMMRHGDGTLHYYINGVDQGPACDNVPSNIYGVIDLYGQCAQVSIVNSSDRVSNPAVNTLTTSERVVDPELSLKLSHRFSYCCGKNIVLDNCNTTAFRCKSYSNGLVFSAQPLESDEHFEVSLVESSKQWSGSIKIGVSTAPICGALQTASLPPVISSLISETWYISGSDVKRNDVVIKSNYCPNLEWLTTGHKVGVRRTSDGLLKFTLNGSDLGTAATNIPKRVFAVVDLFGPITRIAITSMRLQVAPQAAGESPLASYPSGRLADSLEILGEGLSTPTISRLDYGMESATSDAIAPLCSETSLSEAITISQGQGDELVEHDLSFSEHHGKNIQLSNRRHSARRVASYNQAVVVSNKSLIRGHMFQIRIEDINVEWSCGLAFGVTSLSPSSIQSPVNSLALKEHSWIIYKDCIFKNGKKIRTGYGIHGFNFTIGTTIGMLIDSESQLHVYINGYDLGVAATGLPPVCHAVFDLNGRCQQISVIRRSQESDVMKSEVHVKERQESQQEKADLEIQEKYPEQHLIEVTEKAYNKMDVKRRNSKDLNKIEQKLSSSNSYNSGMQQISSQAASCSFQTDTDNVNTQIQQLTKMTDLQRSQTEEENPTMSNSDTYNTELQLLSAHSNSQVNLDDLNMQIQQLTTSNSGGDLSGSVSQNFPHSQSQPFLNKHSKEAPKHDEKIDEDKDAERSSPVSSHANDAGDNEDETTNDIVDSNVESMTDSRICVKNNMKTRRQTVTKTTSVSSQNLRNSQSNMKRKCEYFISCSKFKNMLGLPDEFFSKEPGTCYCDNCYQVCGAEETYKMKGEPPTEYSIPMGWAKFPLKRHPCASDKIDTWQVAFYGTKPGSIRRILDHGELVMPGMLGMERTTIKSKEDDTDSSHITFSPSIKYAASFSKFEFIDYYSKKKFDVTLAFQILVQPGSYKVGPPSIETAMDIDPRFERDATEWVTKERGATVLSALLIKLEC
ncbi:UNVERIFIED_CONTAM: hypothetical protein PYX00_004538 [Menopon gallinae]|uniref:NHR domain-containing protein n=1 Tax=Menopon gallinae TaxID=328185 RepID=A0AAW2I5H6_9NEOP